MAEPIEGGLGFPQGDFNSGALLLVMFPIALNEKRTACSLQWDSVEIHGKIFF